MKFVISPIVDGAGNIISRIISGPGAQELITYEAKLMTAGSLGAGTTRLLAKAITVEEVRTVGVASTIPGLSKVSGATLLYGGKEVAESILANLLKQGWKEGGRSLDKLGGTVIRYISPDDLGQLTYCTVSASKVSGYTVDATFELSTKTLRGWEKIASPHEIKFLLPNVFTP